MRRPVGLWLGSVGFGPYGPGLGRRRRRGRGGGADS
jgi:hypothetical protein